MKRRYFVHLTVSFVLLISTFVWIRYVEGLEAVKLRKRLALLPHRLGEWQGSDAALSDRELEVLGMEDYVLRKYTNKQGQSIWTFVVYYDNQIQGYRIHPPKICLNAWGWTPTSTSREKIHFTKGSIKIAEVNKYLVQKGVEKTLVAYWYHSRGRIITNEYIDRFYLGWDSLTKKRSECALVRVSCSVNDDEIGAWRNLVSFIQLFFPVLQEHLPDAPNDTTRFLS
jgi:EpsI family protein